MSETLSDIEEVLSAKLPIDKIDSLIESLSGLSLDPKFCEEMVSNHFKILLKMLEHATLDNNVMEKALTFFINALSHPDLLKTIPDSKDHQNFSEFLKSVVEIMLTSNDSSLQCKAGQLLSNVTIHYYKYFDEWRETNLETLNKMFEIGLDFRNKELEHLRDLAVMIILNLSQQQSCQRFIVENIHYLDALLDIFNSSTSEKWKLGSLGLLKNLLKTSDFHEDLITKTDLLVILLHPLVGLNKYESKVIEGFPEKLQRYVDVSNELSTELRVIILESLYLLCATKSGRNFMRDSNVYDILKNISELDLTEEESDNCLDCIGLLIRTEDEIGFDNLLSLQIPDDVQQKFNSKN